MILRFVIFVLFISQTTLVLSQNNGILKINPDGIHQFIYEIHEDGAKDFFLNNPIETENMIRFLENNVHFVQYKKIPSSVTQKLSDLRPIKQKFVQKKFDLNTFNPFLYELNLVKEPKKIHIDGTRFVLFITPQEIN